MKPRRNTGRLARFLRRLAAVLGLHRLSYSLACWVFIDVVQAPLTRADVRRVEELASRDRWQ